MQSTQQYFATAGRAALHLLRARQKVAPFRPGTLMSQEARGVAKGPQRWFSQACLHMHGTLHSRARKEAMQQLQQQQGQHSLHAPSGEGRGLGLLMTMPAIHASAL